MKSKINENQKNKLQNLSKNLKKTIFILAIAFIAVLTSCSKDDALSPVVEPTPVANEQDPLSGYFSNSGLVLATLFNTNLVTESGFSFKPLVNGKITVVTAKCNGSVPNVRVTIWNKTTGQRLRTVFISDVQDNLEITKAIAPLEVLANIEYYITLRNNSWFIYKKVDNANINYPIISQDISITGAGNRLDEEDAMPNNDFLNEFRGNVSFKFQK